MGVYLNFIKENLEGIPRMLQSYSVGFLGVLTHLVPSFSWIRHLWYCSPCLFFFHAGFSFTQTLSPVCVWKRAKPEFPSSCSHVSPTRIDLGVLSRVKNLQTSQKWNTRFASLFTFLDLQHLHFKKG